MTLAVSAGAITALVVLRRLVPQVPGPLVLVAAGIPLVALTDAENHRLALIDKVPSGLPSPTTPVLGDVTALLPGAIAIAVMAFLETVLVARASRQQSEPAIDSDQELLAVGMASLAGGLTQSLPPAGGFSQRRVNLRAGARTQLAEIITVVLAAADPKPRAVVLEASAVHQVTVTMLDTLRALQTELDTEKITLYLAGMPAETLEVARRSRWFAELERAGRVQPTVDAAIADPATGSDP